MNKAQIRQLKSGKWVCEVVKYYKFLWFKPIEIRRGLSGLLYEYSIGSRGYANYCVNDEAWVKDILVRYNDRNGE